MTASESAWKRENINQSKETKKQNKEKTVLLRKEREQGEDPLKLPVNLKCVSSVNDITYDRWFYGSMDYAESHLKNKPNSPPNSSKVQAPDQLSILTSCQPISCQ